MKFSDFCKRLAAGTAVLLMGAGCVALGTAVASLLESAAPSGLGLAVGTGVAFKAWGALSPLRMQLLNYVAEGEWKPLNASKERSIMEAFREMAHQDNSATINTKNAHESFSKMPQSSEQPSKMARFCKRLAAGTAILLIGASCVAIGVAVAATLSAAGGGSTLNLGVIAGSFAAATAWEKFSPIRRQLLHYVMEGEWKPASECKKDISETLTGKAKNLIERIRNASTTRAEQNESLMQNHPKHQ